MLKVQIITLIEKGLSNSEIEAETGASNSHIVHTRMEYNELMPEGQKRPSEKRLTKPKEGTQRREAYDYMELYPNARFSEMVEDTKLPKSVCGVVRHLYFSKKPGTTNETARH